jgi:hypothetical protein
VGGVNGNGGKPLFPCLILFLLSLPSDHFYTTAVLFLSTVYSLPALVLANACLPALSHTLLLIAKACLILLPHSFPDLTQPESPQGELSGMRTNHVRELYRAELNLKCERSLTVKYIPIV